ncbi:XRE family transcriptional regulator [Mycetocola reblochoni]|uniref:HTH cro/C1-type domain-containing protein n=2 Tax=Mycetocola reblochoni TaxID=331618 RepID=A0A1R4JPC3_9MICO|nr:helix-turn-helix transcriptional regulator [Mycetocola reblochoni]RLP68392.1 XRE family transcriptional regulator [Mycetocola reblochoni]SJN33848.1 hypothetical protein FM119_08605 [Mycetocola reblochoni REB411]
MTTRRLNGATVRALREALGLRSRDLSERAGIDPGYLTKLENGSRQPSALILRKLAIGLGVSIEVISYPAEVAA